VLVNTYGGSATIVDSRDGEVRGILYAHGTNNLTTFIDDGRQILMDNNPTIGLWRSTPVLHPQRFENAEKNDVFLRKRRSTIIVGDQENWEIERVAGIVYDGNDPAGILTTRDGGISVRRLDSTKPEAIYKTQAAEGTPLIISPSSNGSWIGMVDAPGSISTMAMTDGRSTALASLEIPENQDVRIAIGSAVDGSVLALLSTGSVQFSSADGTRKSREFAIKDDDGILVIDADRRRALLARDSDVLVADLFGSDAPTVLKLPDTRSYPYPLAGAFSSDGNFVAIVRDDGIVNAWDIKRRALVASMGEPYQELLLPAFSPHNDWIDVAATDGSIYRWPLYPSPKKLEEAIDAAIPRGLDEEDKGRAFAIAPTDEQ
jgi:hypothetical protein